MDYWSSWWNLIIRLHAARNVRGIKDAYSRGSDSPVVKYYASHLSAFGLVWGMSDWEVKTMYEKLIAQKKES